MGTWRDTEMWRDTKTEMDTGDIKRCGDMEGQWGQRWTLGTRRDTDGHTGVGTTEDRDGLHGGHRGTQRDAEGHGGTRGDTEGRGDTEDMGVHWGGR